jgi:hypothetical protein
MAASLLARELPAVGAFDDSGNMMSHALQAWLGYLSSAALRSSADIKEPWKTDERELGIHSISPKPRDFLDLG